MYIRETCEPPKKIVTNGKPNFGTFNAPPAKLDICDVKYPFSACFLPTFVTNMRIRGNLRFFFNTENYIGSITFLDYKFLCTSTLILFDKATAKRHVYHSFFGFRRFIPKDLQKACCTTFKSSRFIKFKWDRQLQKASCFFKVKGNSVHPDFGSFFAIDFSDSKFAEIFQVLPSITKRRCTATYCMTSPIAGFIQKNEHSSKKLAYKKNQPPTDFGLCFFDIRRAYYKLRNTENYLIGLDKVDGKNVTFRLSHSNHEPIDEDKYNENVLFVDNNITTLPPVTITRPFGFNDRWIIQDTENMVDLSFFPLSDYKHGVSAFIVHTESHTVYGTFEGELKTKDGTTIRLKGFQGLGKKHLLRL